MANLKLTPPKPNENIKTGALTTEKYLSIYLSGQLKTLWMITFHIRPMSIQRLQCVLYHFLYSMPVSEKVKKKSFKTF